MKKKRNAVWVVEANIGKEWEPTDDGFWLTRKPADKEARQLNDLAKVFEGVRYRVTKYESTRK